MSPSINTESRATLGAGTGNDRSAWTRPEIRRLKAGAAEVGGGGNTDIGVSQS
jgi:hypothetical protein